MMYQIFTGKLPYNDRDMGRQSELKSKEEYVRPSELVPNISREVEAVIVACLKADRELRPRSAEALLAMLEGIRV